MIEWQPISGADIPQIFPVLLIAKYPNSTTWSDPVYGWRDQAADSGWARWYHSFPPTHFAPVNVPAD